MLLFLESKILLIPQVFEQSLFLLLPLSLLNERECCLLAGSFCSFCLKNIDISATVTVSPLHIPPFIPFKEENGGCCCEERGIVGVWRINFEGGGNANIILGVFPPILHGRGKGAGRPIQLVAPNFVPELLRPRYCSSTKKFPSPRRSSPPLA